MGATSWIAENERPVIAHFTSPLPSAALRDVASYLDENPDLVLIGLWNMVNDADPAACQLQAVFTTPVDITGSQDGA